MDKHAFYTKKYNNHKRDGIISSRGFTLFEYVECRACITTGDCLSGQGVCYLKLASHDLSAGELANEINKHRSVAQLRDGGIGVKA